jgi:hypothetical protein
MIRAHVHEVDTPTVVVMTTEIVPRNERRGVKPSSIERRLTKGYAVWFINSTNSSSRFGFPQEDKALQSLQSSPSARFS